MPFVRDTFIEWRIGRQKSAGTASQMYVATSFSLKEAVERSIVLDRTLVLYIPSLIATNLSFADKMHTLLSNSSAYLRIFERNPHQNAFPCDLAFVCTEGIKYAISDHGSKSDSVFNVANLGAPAWVQRALYVDSCVRALHRLLSPTSERPLDFAHDIANTLKRAAQSQTYIVVDGVTISSAVAYEMCSQLTHIGQRLFSMPTIWNNKHRQALKLTGDAAHDAAQMFDDDISVYNIDSNTERFWNMCFATEFLTNVAKNLLTDLKIALRSAQRATPDDVESDAWCISCLRANIAFLEQAQELERSLAESGGLDRTDVPHLLALLHGAYILCDLNNVDAAIGEEPEEMSAAQSIPTDYPLELKLPLPQIRPESASKLMYPLTPLQAKQVLNRSPLPQEGTSSGPRFDEHQNIRKAAGRYSLESESEISAKRQRLFI
jgi:hypothetical protein